MKYHILTLFIGYVLSYAWLLFSSKSYFEDPFPLFKFKIGTQFYFDYLGVRVLYAMIAWVAYSVGKEMGALIQRELLIVFILFVLFVADYLLAFNQPYAYLAGGKVVTVKPESGFVIPLSYSLLMGLSLFFLAVIAWIKL